jgi:hypothetical protein
MIAQEDDPELLEWLGNAKSERRSLCIVDRACRARRR